MFCFLWYNSFIIFWRIKMIQQTQFGKDHWSLLAYIQTLCVDSQSGIGRINANRMRTNKNKRPHIGNSCITPWKESWGTRLQGYFECDKETQQTLQLKEHDDWDCLEDLEQNGLVDIISDVNHFITLTESGKALSLRLTHHKLNGEHYATFKA